MCVVLLHFRRYLCWAAFGACSITLPLWILLQDTHVGPSDRAFLIPFGIGGMVTVVLRTAVSLVTRTDGRSADRTTAKVIARFFAGWLLGIGMSLAVFLMVRIGHVQFPLLSGSMVIAMWSFGGVSMVATFGFSRSRHGCVKLAMAWVAVLLLLEAICVVAMLVIAWS